MFLKYLSSGFFNVHFPLVIGHFRYSLIKENINKN